MFVCCVLADRDPTWELPIAMIRHTPFSFANRNFQSAVFMNQAAQQLTGYTTQEYIDLFRGQPVTFKLYHPNDWGKLMGFEMIALDTTVPATMQAHEEKERADAAAAAAAQQQQTSSAAAAASKPAVPIVWSAERGLVVGSHNGGTATAVDHPSTVSPTNSVGSTSPIGNGRASGMGGGGVSSISTGSTGSSSPLSVSVGGGAPRSPAAPSALGNSGSTSPFELKTGGGAIGGSVNLNGQNSISPTGGAGNTTPSGASASLSSLGGASLSAAQWRMAQHAAAGALHGATAPQPLPPPNSSSPHDKHDKHDKHHYMSHKSDPNVAAGEHTFPGTKSIIIPGMTATPESVELRALVNIVHKSGRLIPAILQSKITLDSLRLPSIVICLMPVPDS